MSTHQTTPRLSYLCEGLAAGLFLTLADALAAGIGRTPWRIHLLSLALGLGVGIAAGLIGGHFRKRGLSVGLVLGSGLALSGLSLASKELGTAANGPTGLLIGALALLAVWSCRDRERGPASTFVLVALVPLAGLIAHAAEGNALLLVAAHALPVIAAVLSRSRIQSDGHLFSLVSSATVLVALVLLSRPGQHPAGASPAQAIPDATGAARSRSDDAPDLILIVIDTLRADALPVDGTLARLGNRGVRFEQCISAAPWTLPSVASILTGLVPSQHGATDALRPLPREVETLAETLRAAGYQTAAFTGGAFVSSTFHLDQGFDYFDDEAEFGFEPFRGYVPLAWRLAKNRYFPLHGVLRFVAEYPGFRGIRVAAEVWLAERDPNRPYFLLLHTYEVHDYYLHHPDPDDGLERDTFDLSARFKRKLSFHPSELVSAPQHDLAWFRAVYDARIAHVEGELETFLSRLDGDADQRVVTVVSDHGEGFDAARQRVHHGGRLHDDLLRVPLLMHGPGHLPAGLRVSTQVRTVDVAPTLLALAGIEAPDGLAGSSLLPLLGRERGIQPGERTAWSEERSNGRNLVSLRRSSWKLLAEDTRRRFIDLVRDPQEEHPIELIPDEALKKLEELESRYPMKRAETIEIDAATQQHLRTLGYVD